MISLSQMREYKQLEKEYLTLLWFPARHHIKCSSEVTTVKRQFNMDLLSNQTNPNGFHFMCGILLTVRQNIEIPNARHQT